MESDVVFANNLFLFVRRLKSERALPFRNEDHKRKRKKEGKERTRKIKITVADGITRRHDLSHVPALLDGRMIALAIPCSQ